MKLPTWELMWTWTYIGQDTTTVPHPPPPVREAVGGRREEPVTVVRGRSLCRIGTRLLFGPQWQELLG